MALESSASLEISDAQQRTFRGLRRFNLIMGFLHLIQGVFMWVVSNDKTYPIFTNYLTFDRATFTLKTQSATVLRIALWASGGTLLAHLSCGSLLSL